MAIFERASRAIFASTGRSCFAAVWRTSCESAADSTEGEGRFASGIIGFAFVLKYGGPGERRQR